MQVLEEKVVKRGDRWCVVHCHGPDAGKAIKCFDTEAEAQAMHRAIQAQKHEALHSDFKRILNLFVKRYGEDVGLEKFNAFIQKNGLDTSKLYNPKVQFQESFEWIEPLIRPYKQDKDAKYYLVTALTADISMNNVDYGPEDRLAREDSSMNWRPVNINHDHSKWLPYPRTRVDFSAANEFSLEATLRVDNHDAWLQDMLDNGEIAHPSIEGRPHPISGRYHFTGLALLEKGVELPGSPLSEIVPLVFNESVGKSLCEFKDGKLVCECTTTKEVKILKEATDDYEPPESGDLPEAGKEILAKAYASCRKNNPDYSKERCSKIAWGAVHNAGYVQGEDGSWRKERKEVNEEVNEEEEEPKIECPEGEHYDKELEKCVPDETQPEDNEEAKKNRDLLLKCSTLELSNIEKTEELKEKERKIVDLENQIVKIKAEYKVERESLVNTKYTQEGRISELKKRLTNEADQKKAAYADRLDVEKSNMSLRKQNEDLRQTNSEQTIVIETLKNDKDNLIRQHKDVFEENAALSSELNDAKTREIVWSKEKTTLKEDIAKAMKHQKYLYEFLKKHNFEIVETP